MSVRHELLSRSIADLAHLIETRDISPVELTCAALEHIDVHDAALKAFISRYDEEALLEAKEAEYAIARGQYRGRLHGIPLAIKDNMYMRGKITTMGSKIHKDFVPSYNAGVIDKLTDAGAIFLGKANLHEYALGVTTENPHYGICRNPWDLGKTAGGSSGGSAVAVATNMAAAALGSDTSGSIRIPAAACGLVGLKPTYGMVSKYGCFPEAWTLDHVGPITGNIADAAILLDAISGHDSNDPTTWARPATKTYETLTKNIDDLVIGVEEAFFFADVDSEIANLVMSGIDTLRSLGAKIKPISLPSLRHSAYALNIIDTSETTTVHDATLRSRRDDYGEDVRYLLECGTMPSAVDYLQAQQLRGRAQLEFDEMFRTVDAIVAPTLPIKTPSIGETTSMIDGAEFDTIENLMRLVGPANLLGLPSLSMPCGVLDGLPIGMQLIGPPLGEQIILNLGAAFESTQPLAHHVPTAYLKCRAATM